MQVVLNCGDMILLLLVALSMQLLLFTRDPASKTSSLSLLALIIHVVIYENELLMWSHRETLMHMNNSLIVQNNA